MHADPILSSSLHDPISVKKYSAYSCIACIFTIINFIVIVGTIVVVDPQEIWNTHEYDQSAKSEEKQEVQLLQNERATRYVAMSGM